MTLYTRDTLFDGDVICNQHVEGYRFSVDAVLAAHFHPPAKNYKILDLGCGCGVIGLICLYRWASLNIFLTGLELQDELYELAKKNIKSNKYDDRYQLLQGDIRKSLELFPAESFDQIICNPPFFKKGSGRTSENDMVYKARHQISGDIEAFLHGASKLVKNKKNCIFIYPASELIDFVDKARKFRLEPKRIQLVYNYPEGTNEARLALLQCQKNGKSGVKVERPFYVYEAKNGSFHKEMEKLYAPNLVNDQGEE